MRHGRATSTERQEAGPTTVADVGRRATVRVTRVSAQSRLAQRLAALGVVPGANLTVLRPHGPALVVKDGARIAIGPTAARAVEVEVLG